MTLVFLIMYGTCTYKEEKMNVGRFIVKYNLYQYNVKLHITSRVKILSSQELFCAA
jgi:hypothetical protein